MNATGIKPTAPYSYRSVRGQIQVEVLPEQGWEVVAAHELRRLVLEVQAYQLQLVGRPGHREIGQAVRELTEAQKLIRTGVTEAGCEIHLI